MNTNERRWILILSMSLILLTSLPYLLGAVQPSDSWVFSGFIFGVEDGNSYIAKMRLGSLGDWFFRTPYTTVQQDGVLAFLPYLLLGKLGGPNANYSTFVLLFHLSRTLLIPFLVWSIYQFLGVFVQHPSWRIWGTYLSTLGGGLGWLLLAMGQTELQGSLPLDFISPETFGFLAVFGLPHLILSRIFMLHSIRTYLQQEKPVLAGLYLVLAGIAQPLTLVSTLAVVFAHQVMLVGFAGLSKNGWILSTWFKQALGLAVPASPLFLYLAFRFSSDPFLKEWTIQNRILSPPPVHYLLAFGLLLLTALIGAWRALESRDLKAYLLVGWVILFPILAYAPHNLQRRLPDGIWVALCALMIGFFANWRASSRIKLWVTMGLSIPLSMSSLFLILGGGEVALNLTPPVHQPLEAVRAYEWLSRNTAKGEIVLASVEEGNVLPAWAPVRVLVGHGPESIHYQTMLEAVERVYDAETPGVSRQDILMAFKIDFLFYGPHERDLGSWSPESESFLVKTYDQAGYQIYRVRSPDVSGNDLE